MLPVTITDSDRENGPIDQQCYLSIQCDWNCVLKNLGEDIWVTWKSEGNPTIHGYIRRINFNEDHTSLTTTNGFKIICFKESMIQVGHCASPNSTIFLPSIQNGSAVHQKKSVSSIDVNMNGLVVSAVNEKIFVWDYATEEPKLELLGHVGDVYKCKYFPSGKVILSCGSDMQLKIWCAQTGKCAGTLSGHKQAITDIGFVGRGKNIISVSKDGTLRLWNCGDSSCIGVIIGGIGIINCCDIFQPTNFDLVEQKDTIDPKEVLTEGKGVLLGCEHGLVCCVGLKSRKKLFNFRVNAAVNCITYLEDNKYVIGCQNGMISLYDFTDPITAVTTWSESQSSVLALLPYKDIGFFAARGDGVVSFKFVGTSNVSLSFTGSNFDPVYDLAINGNFLYTCCRDSTVRKYDTLKVIENISVCI